MALSVGITFASIATDQSIRANRRREKTQKQELALQKATAKRENTREKFRAAAQRRIAQAEFTAQAAQQGQTGTNSAVSGAIGSVNTQTASNIGAANANLAGQIKRATTLNQGARKAARRDTIAGAAQGASTIGFGFANG